MTSAGGWALTCLRLGFDVQVEVTQEGHVCTLP
jgi:hypothetical protein